MYGFPKVTFSKSAIKAAKAKGIPVDSMYCMDMLEQTGILTVPGNQFGQAEGSHHFRITNLSSDTQELGNAL